MADDFQNYQRLQTGAFTRGAAVTPSDSTDLADVASALWIGGAGNVNIDTVGGDTVTLNGALAGTIVNVRTRRVRATGTTATNIVALR